MIDESIRFAVVPTAAEDLDDGADAGLSTSFCWWDSAGDDDDTYLFVCSADTPIKQINQFAKLMHSCMYERKYGVSSSRASAADLEEFRVAE